MGRLTEVGQPGLRATRLDTQPAPELEHGEAGDVPGDPPTLQEATRLVRATAFLQDCGQDGASLMGGL